MNLPNLTNCTKEELIRLAEYTEAIKEKYKYEQIKFIYPETGKYSRYAYPVAMDFFKAGSTHNLRMFSAPNGAGKSFCLAYELACHVTGDYPDWWEGKKQMSPKHWWILTPSGDTFKSSMQRLLLGNTLNEEDLGTGLIPKASLHKITGWPSIAGACRSFEVRHKDGHLVTVEVKSSKQDREDIQAANLDGLLEDEEPDYQIHTEALFRLRDSPRKPFGLLMLGYSPINGLTELTLQWLPDGQFPENGQHPTDKSKYIAHIDSLDEVPHLSEEYKQIARDNCPPHLIEARLHGRPGLGAGKIYPYPESQVFVEPRSIPEYWPRAFSLDFGHHITAVLWFAKDPHTKILYQYAEYYHEGHQTAQVHALNIKARGAWIPGICDPSGGGRQNDGRLLQELFEAEGLSLVAGENSFLVGVTRICNMIENGSFKVFNSCQKTKQEFRTYRFDSKEPNKPARNQKDHAMDNWRYATSMFDSIASTEDDGISDDGYDNTRKGYDLDSGY